MDLFDKANQLSDKDFKQIIGVEKKTFNEMVKILNEAYLNKPRKWRGERKKKLSMENQLFMTLKYLRQYVTQKELAFEFEVGEATVCDTIKWVENILIKDGTFSLPGKKALLEDDSIEVMKLSIILDTFFSNRMKYRKQKVEEKADSSVYAAKAY